MPRAFVLVPALLAGVALAVLVVVPFATVKRRVPASVPQPAPLFAQELLEVPSGQRACLRGITIDEHSEVAELRPATFGAPPIPFTLTLSGLGGYTATARSPAYVDNQTVGLAVRPPRTAVRGEACLENRGEQRLAFYASGDRTRRGSVVATLDGRRQKLAFQLAFVERRPGGLARRAGALAEYVSTYRPVGPAVIWVLGSLVLLGVPVALTVALVRAGDPDAP